MSVSSKTTSVFNSPSPSRFSSPQSSPLSPPSPTQSIPATPGENWSPRPGMPPALDIGLPATRSNIKIQLQPAADLSPAGSTAVSPAWSPAPGSLLLGEASPAPSSSAELLDDDEPEDCGIAELREVTAHYTEAVAKCTVNPRYYFEDRISYFKVENQKFKVHRHFLVRDSIYFQELFAGPLGDFGERESEAIPLEGVGSSEFECLLEFFYTGMYRQNSFSLAQWITLLSISTRLRFDLLREHAIQAIEDLEFNTNAETLDPIEKIVLATKYHVPVWLAPAYISLCRRPHALSEWEAEKIGLGATVRVAKAREVYRERRRVSGSHPSSGLKLTVPPVVTPLSPSPVYCWRQNSDSAMLSPIQAAELDQARAERVVDEVFFTDGSTSSRI
ncbi:BTB domain-containing protein [Mycena kentingensis (nom. inval.)]|nr:BTB domain-containing protein [Mycena kentingensis (nom. inval.)]